MDFEKSPFFFTILSFGNNQEKEIYCDIIQVEKT